MWLTCVEAEYKEIMFGFQKHNMTEYLLRVGSIKTDLRRLEAETMLLCQQQFVCVSPKHVNIHVLCCHGQYDASCNMLIHIQRVEECICFYLTSTSQSFDQHDWFKECKLIF